MSETTNPTTPQQAGGKTGSIVNMNTGDKKDSGTGRTKGNKKKGDANQKLIDAVAAKIRSELNLKDVVDAAFATTAVQAKEIIEEGVRKVRLSQVEREAEFLKNLAEMAEKSGHRSLADALRGSQPQTLTEKIKAHSRRPINMGDVYLVVGGGVVLAVVWNGASYLLRNKVALPFSMKWKTGIAAERRADTGSKPRIPMGGGAPARA